jgi:hypothetical protein
MAASALPGRRSRQFPVKTVVVGGGAVFTAFVFSSGGPLAAELLLGLMFVVGFVALSAVRPAFSVIGIVVWVPSQTAVLSYLYNKGLPTPLVKDLGYFKELWAIGLAVAVLRSGALSRRFDGLDWLVASYVGIASAYLLLPVVAPGALGGLPWSVRLNAWRLIAMFVVVFFCARRLNFSPAVMRALFIVVAVEAIALAGFAFWEATDKTGFNDFLVDTINLPAYKADLFDRPYPNPANLLTPGSIGGTSYNRAGSIFASPLTLGFFMLIPFGLALERIGGRRLWLLAAVAGGGSLYAIFLTVTRSALIGAVIAVLLAATFTVSRSSPQRLRVFVLLGIAVAFVLPAAGQSATVARFEALFTHTQLDPDAQGHVDSPREALNATLAKPFGLGLGSNSATGTRFGAPITITAENSYLETAVEIGMVPAALFLGSLIVMMRHLRRRSQQPGAAASLAGGAWLSGWALTASGMFLQTWYELPVALVFWTIAGVALSGSPPEPDDAPVEAHANATELITAAY